MSDQVYDDPGAEESHEADIDAGFDNAEESTAPAGNPGPALPGEQDDTSHDSDIDAGSEDHASDASEDDKRLGLR